MTAQGRTRREPAAKARRRTATRSAEKPVASSRRSPRAGAAAASARARRPVGTVALVGAGPGDPGLLTVRGAELLAAADVVVTEVAGHDRLLAACRPGVEVVDGGRDTDGRALTPSVRGRLLVRHARGGARVVRLLAGDPFLYASGPEEALACSRAGIPCEVVPGVSAATGVPAYAGIPLTDRRHREVAVVDVGNARVDWAAYADGRTLVLLSTARRVGDSAEALVAAGRKPTTPAAVTVSGTTTEQRTVVTTLAELGGDIRAAGFTGATVTVVGDVVAGREHLSWFETKPLFGWRVLVPRTKAQAGPLSARLREYGAVAEEVPTISVERPRNPHQMDRAVRGLVEGRYEWVAFTSVNALRAVREKFDEYGLDARAFSGLKVAAVGDATAEAVRAWGISPDLTPAGEQSAHGLLAVWPPYDDVLDPINRVFLPRADIATETLAAGLVRLGWEVDAVTAYRTVRATPPPAPVREAIKAGRFDAVVFTSSSTVRNLVGIAGKPHPSTLVTVIGPQTAQAATDNGLRVDVVAETPSAAGVADALAEFAEARRTEMMAAGEPVARPSQRPSQRSTATRRRS